MTRHEKNSFGQEFMTFKLRDNVEFFEESRTLLVPVRPLDTVLLEEWLDSTKFDELERTAVMDAIHKVNVRSVLRWAIEE